MINKSRKSKRAKKKKWNKKLKLRLMKRSEKQIERKKKNKKLKKQLRLNSKRRRKSWQKRKDKLQLLKHWKREKLNRQVVGKLIRLLPNKKQRIEKVKRDSRKTEITLEDEQWYEIWVNLPQNCFHDTEGDNMQLELSHSILTEPEQERKRVCSLFEWISC